MTTARLRDGLTVRLRPIGPWDKHLLAAAFAQLDDESRYRRSFASLSDLSAAQLTYLTEVDHRDHEAIVALDPTSGDLVGVARYVRSTDQREIAEVAVTVADDWQGRGLGRLLLTRLARRARLEGIRRFSARVLADNGRALAVLESVGATERLLDGTEVVMLIELPQRRGIGTRMQRALRAVADGSLVVVDTITARPRR